MENIENVLEINRIKENCAKYSKTILGKDKILNLTAHTTIDSCQNEFNKIDELRKITDEFGDLPLRSELDMYQEIENIKKGGVFDELKLNMIKSEIQDTTEVIKYSLWIDYDVKYLSPLFLNLKACELVYSKINQTISPENTVKDSASEELSNIRRKIYGLNKEVHSLLNKLIAKYKDKLSGTNYVLRNGKYALPINTSSKASIDGIVQDISDSGQTTFIEPKEVLQLENDIILYELKEKDEVRKILNNLTDLVMQNANMLIQNNEILADLDVLNSKVKFAKEIDANVPMINNDHILKLFNARHPLINKEVCVPNDFIFERGKTLMIISGPNAGGKTIALKTVGLLCYMVKLGFPIPAAENSNVYFYDNIYVDIGDAQSIESNLSTFSGHISNLSVIFKYISSRDLVIIDELCNGTDPKEGEALAVAIVRFLLEKKATTLITSHYELLKKFGFTDDRIINASFLFNEKTVTPTFKILLGVSGKSYGFLISKKFGIDEKIINEAREIYENSFADENDKKIAKLDEKERYLLQKEAKLKAKQEKLVQEREELAKKVNELKDKENKIKSQKIDKFDDFLESKYNEVNNILNELKRTNDAKKAEAKLDKINVKKKKNENIKLDDYVEVKSLGIKGRVTEVNGNKIFVATNDGFTLKTTKDQCEIIDKPVEKRKANLNVDKFIMGQKQVSSSLNLIGYHIDEGIAALDKYLDDCILKGLKEVKIIHGYGTGKLKLAIHDYLKTKKHVEKYRIGTELDGGSGATIVNLK